MEFTGCPAQFVVPLMSPPQANSKTADSQRYTGIKTMRLSVRIILLNAGVIVALGLACCLAARFGITHAFEAKALGDLSMTRSNVTAQAESLSDIAVKTSALAAMRRDIASSLTATNLPALEQAATEIRNSSGTDLLLIAGLNGELVGGLTGPTNAPTQLHDLIKQALSGAARGGLVASRDSLLQCAANPILSDNKVVGAVVAGMDLLKDHRFVDQMRHRFGVECTVFANDTRVSTTIIRENKRAVGTKMDNPAVLEAVLKRGEVFENRNTILGRHYNTAYWPLKDIAGQRVGMLFIGLDRQLISHATNEVLKAVVLSILLVGALGAVFSVMLSRRIAGQIHSAVLSLSQASDQVHGGAAQVAEASQSLAEGSSEQAASLQETSASLEELSSITQRNAESAEHVTQLARTARSAADSSAADMQAMSQAMHDIKQSSDDISKIISTIDEIAFQTNILALNAAVEAARAGEAGMGFAVVADEVRNLAQRSAQAARETAGKIEDAINRTSNGVLISEKVVKRLQEIMEHVRQLDQLVSEVASASKEQSQGIAQLNAGVSQMDRVTQTSAAHAEETASAAEELNAQAEAIKHALVDLLGIIGGKSSDRGSENQPTPGRHDMPVVSQARFKTVRQTTTTNPSSRPDDLVLNRAASSVIVSRKR